ncbi:hypothetical protein [Actibacterium pelagium]|uniref:Adenylosuccinate lyase n=1 Tax=Actibacterium pelagium TaxID=2029103 RepID=A0A917ABG6_9RHOB|nr:hypothetical protein [Actibacterium pelagium]GGE40289.1 hypothetical protein GCM10011517_05000 [Actibacterium pelagium]
MTIKVCVAGAVLTLLPAFAMACPAPGHEKHAISCAQGLVLDEDTGRCVAKSTS